MHVDLIRVYLYLSEGIISSKQEAGNWGLSSLPKEMFLTLQKVMYNYSHKQEAYQFGENELLFIRNYFANSVRGLLCKRCRIVNKGGYEMELKIEYYVLALLVISFGFFVTIATFLEGTNEAYRDFLLTIAVVHFVMSKLITIKKRAG